MPHSRKELRKMSKALRRSECGSNISTRSSSFFSPAKDTKDNITASVNVSAEDGAYQLKPPKSRQHSTARSLSETFASSVVQKQWIASDRGERISDGAAMVAPATPRHRLLDVQCPDPLLDGNRLLTLERKGAMSKLESTQHHSEASVEDNLDKASASSTFLSHTSLKDIANTSQPEISEFWRSTSANSSAQPSNAFLERLRSSKRSPTLPTNGAKQGKGVQEPLAEKQATPLGTYKPPICLRANPYDFPSAPTKLRNYQTEIHLSESFDGTKERPSQSMLVNNDSKDIDQGSRTKRWIEQTQQHGSVDPYAFAPLKLVARSTAKPIDLPARTLPSTTGTTQVEASDNIEAANEVQSEATTLLERPRPIDEVLSDMGRLLTDPSDFGSMRQSFIRHPQGPPWGYHPQNQYSWFNNPAPYRPARERAVCDQMQGAMPGVYHDVSGPQSRQHDPVTVPMSLPQRRGLPPSNPTHRYEPAFFETSTEACRRLRYPDWTQDARGRVEIPRPPKEDERTSLMNLYTRRFYGGQLDAARDLHYVERPDQEHDLGGLLS